MGLFSSVGKIFNDITGVTASAKANNAFQKEFAKNAHQWEAEDLEKAGLNRAISLSTGGATAGGAGGGQVNSGGGIIGEAISSAKDWLTLGNLKDNLKSDTELKEAQTEKNNAEAVKQLTENKYIDQNAAKDLAKKQEEITRLKQEVDYHAQVDGQRVAKIMGETEKELSEGYISRDNAEFLKNYGITKEQAIQLGEQGIKMIAQMITAKAGAKEVSQAAKEIIKNRNSHTNSAATNFRYK